MRSTGITITLVGYSAILLLLVAESQGGTLSSLNYEDPKKDMCSPFEVLKASEPCCEPTCDDDCSHAICRRTPDAASVPTCVCRQGYVRHDGRCIQKESCPPFRSTERKSVAAMYDLYRAKQHHTSPPPAGLRSCGPNEKVTHCRPSCVATCERDCTGMRHPEVCVPETSCVCKEGLVRHKGRCIKKGDCPKRNPLSGEYIDFEVVSLEGMKSDEEFNYQPRVEHRFRKPSFPIYEQKKPSMLPSYVRTVTNTPKPVVPATREYPVYTTEKPALFPPLCACHRNKHTHVPAYVPQMEDTPSHESTEEESDIVPYAPPPPAGSFSHTSPLARFPPSTPASAGPYFVPRKTLPAPPPPPVHRNDFNEPLDHFFGSGQAVSAQQNSAAQEDLPRKSPTIWPPVSSYSTRCSCLRRRER